MAPEARKRQDPCLHRLPGQTHSDYKYVRSGWKYSPRTGMVNARDKYNPRHGPNFVTNMSQFIVCKPKFMQSHHHRLPTNLTGGLGKFMQFLSADNLALH